MVFFFLSLTPQHLAGPRVRRRNERKEERRSNSRVGCRLNEDRISPFSPSHISLWASRSKLKFFLFFYKKK
ncbi:hypothetical protein VIGAN_08257800 [Vigna angularis var. angularis]|uniref:Uncharacterized protein n=1 Tax=Vigna angularis var. angularis TaxID=157739 RepID=A0A0S3SSI1_PHAAN|nr:hypothetical protein VIGAN_08257800 [Vigna angularis var. angularis]